MTAVPTTADRNSHFPSFFVAAADLKLVLWTIFFLVTSLAIRGFGTHPTQITWLLADLAAVGLFFKYQSQFINLALSNLIFMSWPLVACLSAIWSIAPVLSFSHGLQLLMTTLVAFLLCIQLRLGQLVGVLFCALLVAAVITLATEMLLPNPSIDGSWRGSFPHKNMMGSAMALLVITASCILLHGRWRAVPLAAIVLGLFLLVKSNSAAALLSMIMTLTVLPFAYARLRGGATFLVSLGSALVVLALAAVGLYISMIALGTDPIDIVLGAVGKERTLTGRTLLWDLAEEAINSRPWLGFGYKAYWTNVPPEMLEVLSIVGGVFHFHNNYLDVAVAFGVIGPILLALGILTGLARSIRLLLSATTPIDVWPLLIVIMATILTFVENPLVWNHAMWQVLFVAAVTIRR
jgi:O-antigen ligase